MSDIQQQEGRNRCALCLRTAEHSKYRSAKLAHEVICRTCGTYWISSNLRSELMGEARDKGMSSLLPYLRAYVRQSSDRDVMVHLEDANWRTFAQAHRGMPVQRKTRRLLELFSHEAEPPGTSAPIDLEMMALRVDAFGPKEVEFLLGALLAEGLLETRQRPPDPRAYTDDMGGRPPRPPAYLITAKGWATIAPIGGARPDTCFVAMSFRPELNEPFDNGSSLAIKDCGFQFIRMDRLEHNDLIDDRMMALLRTAAFVVADVTRQRQNVYFEGGFALGLGRPVIWCLQENELEEVHFDTSHFAHITWKDSAPPDEAESTDSRNDSRRKTRGLKSAASHSILRPPS